MKEETTRANEHIAHICDQEDFVVSMPSAADDTFNGEIYEQEVCERINYFGGVVSCIIVLFAPIKGRCDRMPVAWLHQRRVGY